MKSKIISIITSAVLATSALTMPAMSSSAYFLNSRFDDKYIYTNADGLFDSNTSHGLELYYEEQSMTKKELSTKLENSSFYPSFYVNYIQHFYDKYAFDFADINDSTVQVEKAVGILSKYYGELKKTDSMTSDDKNIQETYENGNVKVTYYYEYDRNDSPCNNGCSVEIVKTTRDADKKISNEVMKDLYKEGLISSFYDIGQVGYSSFIQLNPLFYKIGTDTDIESLQSYLDENKLDYTVKLNDEKDPLYESYGYIIEPNKDSITLSESLDLAKKLHSEFGITPYAEIAERGSNAVGHNALDDYIKSQETTATEETTDKIELPTQEITEPTKETTTEPKEIKLGDINGDNAIDSKDAVLVLKSYADALANNKTYYEKAADVNNDGKVDSKDAVEILKTYAKNLAENKAWKLRNREKFMVSKNYSDITSIL